MDGCVVGELEFFILSMKSLVLLAERVKPEPV